MNFLVDLVNGRATLAAKSPAESNQIHNFVHEARQFDQAIVPPPELTDGDLVELVIPISSRTLGYRILRKGDKPFRQPRPQLPHETKYPAYQGVTLEDGPDLHIKAEDPTGNQYRWQDYPHKPDKVVGCTNPKCRYIYKPGDGIYCPKCQSRWGMPEDPNDKEKHGKDKPEM